MGPLSDEDSDSHFSSSISDPKNESDSESDMDVVSLHPVDNPSATIRRVLSTNTNTIPPSFLLSIGERARDWVKCSAHVNANVIVCFLQKKRKIIKTDIADGLITKKYRHFINLV